MANPEVIKRILKNSPSLDRYLANQSAQTQSQAEQAQREAEAQQWREQQIATDKAKLQQSGLGFELAALSGFQRGQTYGAYAPEMNETQRKALEYSKELYPKTAFVSELAGGIVSPLTRLGAGIVGGASKILGRTRAATPAAQQATQATETARIAMQTARQSVAQRVGSGIASQVLPQTARPLAQNIGKAAAVGAVDVAAYSGISTAGDIYRAGGDITSGENVGKILGETSYGALMGAGLGAGIGAIAKGIRQYKTRNQASAAESELSQQAQVVLQRSPALQQGRALSQRQAQVQPQSQLERITRLPETVTGIRRTPAEPPSFTQAQTRQLDELERTTQIERQRILQTEKNKTARTQKLEELKQNYNATKSAIQTEQRVMTPDGEGVVVSKATKRTQVKVGDTTKYYKDADVTPIQTQGKPGGVERRTLTPKQPETQMVETPAPQATKVEAPAPTAVEQSKVAIRYSESIQKQLDEAEAKYKEDVRYINTSGLNAQEKSSRLRALGMQHSANKRNIIQGDSLIPVPNGLTGDELAQKIKREKSNYNGKPVITPDGEGTAIGKVSYGKVGVNINGQVKYYTKEQVTSKVNVDEIIRQQQQAVKQTLAPAGQSKTATQAAVATAEAPTALATPAVQAGKQRVVSSRNIKDIPLTNKEFDAYYGLDKRISESKVDELFQDVGARVINRTGSDNVNEVLNIYKKKYNLANDLKVKMTEKMPRDIKGRWDPDTNTIYIKKGMNAENTIGTLRHEIEHAIDRGKGYRGAAQKVTKAEAAKISAREAYLRQQKGEHQKYAWFEKDYLRRAMVKDALLEGKQLPQELMDEFKDVVQSVATKQATQRAREAIKKARIQGEVKTKVVETPVAKKQPASVQPQQLVAKQPQQQAAKQPQQQAQPTVTATQPAQATAVATRTQPVPKQVLKNTPEQITNSVVNGKEIKAVAPDGTSYKVFDDVGYLTETPSNKKYRFEQNVVTTPMTEKGLAEYVEQTLQKRGVIENRQVIDLATRRFNRDPKQAYTDFLARTADSKFDIADVPLSRLIANDLYSQGRVAEAREVVSIMAEKLLNAGRFVQAANIFKKSEPMAYATYIQRQITKINNIGAKKYGNKWKDVKLSDALMNQILNSRQINDDLIEAVAQDVNGQIPVTFLEKFTAYRRMAMLLNLKTHVKNLAGNTIMLAFRNLSDSLATGLEQVLIKDPTKRTKAFGWKNDPDIVRAVDDTWTTQKDRIMAGGKYETEYIGQALPQQGERRIFQNELLQKAHEFSHNALQKGDFIFLRNAFKTNLGSYMKAQGLKEVTDDAIRYAQEKAYQATFRDNTALSNIISTWKKQGGVLGQAAEALFPFVKTPAALALRAIEYSPLGFANMLQKTLRQQYKNDAGLLIEDLSKALTGSGVMALGYYLANFGLAKVGMGEKGKGYAIEREAGEQKFGIYWPGAGSYSFDWAQPIAVPLALGVSFQEAVAKNLDPEKALSLDTAMIKVLNDGAKTFANMSMLKSLTDLFNSGNIAEGIGSLGINYINQAIPTLVGQVSRVSDEYKRETYDPSFLGKLGKTIVAKTPAAKFYLDAKVDIFGEPIQQNTAIFDGMAGRLVQESISVGVQMKANKDKLTNELTRLYKMTSDTEFLPREAPKTLPIADGKMMLTTQQRREFQIGMGQNNYRYMSKYVNSKDYEDATDEQRMRVFKEIAKATYEKEKMKFTGGKTKEEEKAQKEKSRENKKILSKAESKGYIPRSD